jgi:hypothetical protein
VLETGFKYFQGAIDFALHADFLCLMINKDTHTEAMRCVADAREFLRKAGKEGAYYSDPKHVKIAGIPFGTVFCLP